jgi:putrescine transport system permease protein
MYKKISLNKVLMTLALIFIYTPIAILVLYSFNNSCFVNIWGGFSTKWYSSIFQDEALIDAVLTSLKIATSSATIATILGTMAGLALSRLGRFHGRTLFIGMLSAPFIIPEVITGFSLLLIFVVLEQIIGWPKDRGSLTVILAHTTIGISYVAITVLARLASFDKSLEEAALDLGAHPMKVFFVITLPIIAKSLVAGWLLSFTLSIDDVVIASFTSGAGTTTLPMLIYSRMKFGISPQINALATLMVGSVILAVLIAYVMSVRKK